MTPDVFVLEPSTDPPPIEGVSTNTAGMAGRTERGPVEARLITSWAGYQDLFGGTVNGLCLPAAVQGFFENGGRRVFVARAVGGDVRAGLDALEAIDEISLLTVPDEVHDSSGRLTAAVVAQCERRKDRFAILNARGNHDNIATLKPPHDTSYGAFYYPWLRVWDSARREAVLVPPGGHVAGIYARTDMVRGVHKAPANEVVRGVFTGGAGAPPSLEFTITDREQEILNPRGVNVIRDFSKQGRGVVLWGARTMSSDPVWKYVNVRRLLMYVEHSIDKGTQWVVFERNNERTWSLLDRHITIFLGRLWRDGMLMGSREDQAFFVRCDRTTMTQNDIDNGRLICVIGLAPLKPAEFVIFRIGQWTADRPPYPP